MSRTILTAGQHGADIDVLGCAVAYAELLHRQGNEALAVVPGAFTASVTPSILEWRPNYQRTYDAEPTDQFVLVDISDPAHFATCVAHDRISELYDHRPGFEAYWQNRLGERSHIERVGACGTLIWEAWRDAELLSSLGPVSAKLLLASIVSNTLNFRSPATTERDRTAFAALEKSCGLDGAWIGSYFQEQAKSIETDFADLLRADTKIVTTPEGSFCIGQLELWDASSVVAHKREVMDEVMQTLSPHPWVVNIVAIERGGNELFTTNQRAQKILEQCLPIRFMKDVARTDFLVQRKQLMQLLRSRDESDS